MPRVWAASWYHVGAQGLCCCRQGHADLRGLCCHLGHGGVQTQAADMCRFCIHDPAIAGVRDNVHGPCEHGGGGVVIGTALCQVSPTLHWPWDGWPCPWILQQARWPYPSGESLSRH